MKALIYTLLLLLGTYTTVSFTPIKGFILTANVTGFANGAKVTIQSVERSVTLGRATVKDNHFVLEGIIENGPEELMLVIKDGEEMFWCTVFIANEAVTLTAGKAQFPYEVNIAGSAYHDKVMVLNMLNAPLEAARRNLETEYLGLPEAQRNAENNHSLYWGEKGKFTLIDNKLDSVKKVFISQNLNSEYALSQLKEYATQYKRPEAAQLYAEIDPALKDSKWAKAIKIYAESSPITIGQKVPNLSAPDKDRKMWELYPLLKNKPYTLIDFSTPFCGYAGLSIPMIKKIQQQYGDKLQCISVCVDTNAKAWEKETKDKDIKWLRLIAPDGRYGNAFMQYEIYGTPTFLLVDNNGMLVQKWRGYSEKMPEELAGMVK